LQEALRESVATAVKISFAELYRSAFAETDPQTKQQLLQQVQSLIDVWHVEQQQIHLVVATVDGRVTGTRGVAP
jgi:hypothetical protein